LFDFFIAMKKIIGYFLITAAIFLVTALIVGLVFLHRRQEAANQVIPKAEETIRVLEGWTSRDIGQYFERAGKWQSEEFLEVIGFPQVDYRRNKDLPQLRDLSIDFSFLADKPKYYGLEGYLFPDTYRVYASSTVTDVIYKMLSNFDNKLTPQMRADIKAQGKTIYDIVTMASIIEKEAALDYQKNDNHDARIISGIFWHRLKIGQALQSDATLSYVLNDNEPSHSGRDLDNTSPYNTYKYRGLPPGPICNPGRLAIEAAIHPLDTEYNYFLTPKGKDTIVYAKSYEEHLRNKYKYLR